MHIAFSGPQSSGKSTLLRQVKKLYPNDFLYVEEVTRTIANTYKVPINEGATDLTQILIVNHQLQNSLIDYKTQNKAGVIHDRCLIDGYVYTEYLYNRGKLSPNNNTLGYAKQLLTDYLKHIDCIFYTDPSDVPLVDDGVRSSNVAFRDDVTARFERIIALDDIKSRVMRLKGTVEQRMELVNSVISKLTL